jgi:hypothetical protein
MSRTGRDRLRIRWILPALRTMTKALVDCRGGGLGSGAGRFVPCQVREDFMDHRSSLMDDYCEKHCSTKQLLVTALSGHDLHST